jgi:hypothetical protein
LLLRCPAAPRRLLATGPARRRTMARVIDGKEIALCVPPLLAGAGRGKRGLTRRCRAVRDRDIRRTLTAEIAAFKQQYQVVPGLAIVQVGDREDSSIYVRMKEKAAIEVWAKPYPRPGVGAQS